MDKKLREFVLAYLDLIFGVLKKSRNVKEDIYNLPVPKSDNIRKTISQEQKKDKNQIEQKIQDI